MYEKKVTPKTAGKVTKKQVSLRTTDQKADHFAQRQRRRKGGGDSVEAETHSDADAPKAVTNMFARTETGSPLIYHPMTASYRVNDT
ncbi:MAG: hypothetical protein MK179_22275 [Pirellulaceae bacterium]|nr:hypothetical protein [Pirellulaceae bacterium]